MSYVDVDLIQATDPGDPLTAAWCDQVRDNLEFLVAPPACSVGNTATQSVTSQTTPRTVLNAPDEFEDNDGMHSTVSSNSRITIQTPGLYLLTTTVIFPVGDAATDRATTDFLVNGSDVVFGDVRNLSNGGGVTVRASVARTQRFVAADYVEVAVTHNGSGTSCQLDEFAAFFMSR